VFFAILLSLLTAARSVSADAFWQRLTWTTTDGVRLVGLYHPAHGAREATWVLLHGLGSSKGEWDAFARKLAAEGSGVFLYDARGHSESNHLATGETITYESWRQAGPGSPWDKMPSDLASAVGVLQKRFGLPEKSIAVGGASLGANVALIYASEHPKVPALVLLSPGMEYAGIQSAYAYEAYRGRPVLMAASPGDIYAYNSVKQLSVQSPNPRGRVVDGKQGHGVNMFDEKFTKIVVEWMTTAWK